MIPVTIRVELKPDDDAQGISICVSQGPVLLRHATVPAHDAVVTFDLDVGDYVASAGAVGSGGQVWRSFAVPQETAITLQVP